MELDDRKIKILEAIIDDYIKTAEPVGSRTIEKKHELGISSATIRNEMADLEELGFLTHPHTSAGRIPSDKGYRLYVDEMLKHSKVSAKQRKQIDDLFNKTYSSLDYFMKDLSNLLSELTNYTVVTSKIKDGRVTIKNIQLINIDPSTILLVTVLDKSQVKNNVLHVNESVSQEVLTAIADLLNEELDNKTLSDINLDLITDIKMKLGKYKNILDPILDIITDMINEIDKPEFFASGINNILSFPEFTDITVAKNLIGVMENQALLTNLLTNATDNNDEGKEVNFNESNNNDNDDNNVVIELSEEDIKDIKENSKDKKSKKDKKENKKESKKQKDETNNDVSIRIGNENVPYAKDCSIITYKYDLDDTNGTISIIGPKRMDYENSISVLKAIIKSMELKKEASK
ncbi:MAG: heat-inducible transcriptional repressor HrcA [Clostridia bacterium]|nr:heat-inducible transcriptional repressor HrcA [Clostridia bacterium]